VLVDVVGSRSRKRPKDRQALVKRLSGIARVVNVGAFRSRREFQESLVEPPWGSVVWFSDEPDHMIHFNGDRFLGPR
jgi:hypothetical protein